MQLQAAAELLAQAAAQSNSPRKAEVRDVQHF